MRAKELLSQCTGFEWDDGNFDKNLILHRVSALESEEVFFNHPLFAQRDDKHSANERRYYCLGHTDTGRLLFIAFTIRGRNIKVISARDMTSKEEEIYLSQ
ncbi:MAG: BrnT family toxin [Chitinivibrionales bacterium]|nr:BrnT family toxin [Chitinivibrionales bacterium]